MRILCGGDGVLRGEGVSDRVISGNKWLNRKGVLWIFCLCVCMSGLFDGVKVSA